MNAAMIQGEDPSMAERRAAQRERIAERHAIRAQQSPMAAWVRRGSPDEDVHLAYDLFLKPLWDAPADGSAPQDASLLRWMLFGVAPIAALGCLWLLGASLPHAQPLQLAALAVDATILLLAFLVAIALGLGRTSPAIRRFIGVAAFAGAVIGIVTLAVGVLLTARAVHSEASRSAVIWPLIRALAPLLCLAVALLRYRAGVRRQRAIEGLAQRCGLEVHVGATILRQWLDRYWEGEASTDQLAPRSSSAYLLTGRIEGFDVAIEVRLDNAPFPTQILVAAALDLATIDRLTASLRASGFAARGPGDPLRGGTGGVVASPVQIGRKAIARAREEDLGVLRDGVHGIVAFLSEAGVRPRPPIAE